MVVNDEGLVKSQINEILCEGCGVCVVTCPSNAITMNHYTDAQIEAMIENAFKESSTPAP